MALRVSIPADYSSITLKHYRDFKQAKNEIEQVCACCSITKEQAKEIPIKDLPVLINAFNESLLVESARFFQQITIKDKDFAFIPNLYEITAGEYADISEWCKDVNTNIVKIMGVLYRPIDKRVVDKYTIEKYTIENRVLNESYVEQMTLEQFNGAMLFFSTLLRELNNTSLDYLENEVKKLTKEMEQLTTEKD
jgi:hypothetical protein